jgi:hypothetical protein
MDKAQEKAGGAQFTGLDVMRRTHQQRKQQMEIEP